MENDKIKQVIELLQRGGIGRGSAYERFFNKINNQIWIKPLYKNGFFQNPIETQKTKEGISFLIWVESRYIARAVPYDKNIADLIIKIVLDWDTDNESIHEDIVDIIMGLPSNKIYKLLDREAEWLHKTTNIYMMLPRKYQKLIKHLSELKLDKYAIMIAKNLLDLIPDPKYKERGGEKKNIFPPTPQTKFDTHQYQDIIKNTISNIYIDDPLITIDFLCELLNNWIELSRGKKDPEKYYDYSHIWRNQIDSSDEKRAYSISDTLVSTIKKLAINYLKNNPEKSNKINEVFEKYEWGIFKRFSMFILKDYPNRKLIKKYLVDYKYFTDGLVHNEYVLLLKKRFSDLGVEDQNIILKWIDNGPDIDLIKENHKGWHKKTITSAELSESIKEWKIKKLRPITNSLSSMMLERYGQFIETEIAIKDDDIIRKGSTGAVSWGPTSPYSEEELGDLPVKQIIKKVKLWKYQVGHMDPSPEGLGRVLTSLVKNRARELSKEAELFIDLKPNYVRGFITGLKEHVKTNNDIYWLPVLKLCKWAIEQQDLVANGDQLNQDPMDYDVKWEWTRKSIADLLGAGLSGGSEEIPFRYRKRIWELLAILIEDPDPTIEREKESLKQSWDPFTDSINCTRGEAMHSFIQYGLWCKRSIELKRKKQFSFQDAEELELKLSLYLDHRHEKSLAVHSVYGHWFPWLLLLDEKWAIKHLDKIFPLEIKKIDYWKAAWQGYINFRSPYNNVLKYLMKSYLHAIKQTPKYDENDERNFPENSFKRLIEHLLIYYWREELDLSPNGLIDKFFGIAPQKLRAFAISFIGFSLRENPGSVEEKFVKQLIKLWEWRIKEFDNSNNKDGYFEELANFGHWFSSGKLDNEWSLNQLEYVLKNCNKLEDRQNVIKQLSIEVKKNISKTLEICSLMLNIDLKPWEIHSWEEYLREILKSINANGSAKDKENGLVLIDRLGSLGQYKYRDIWELMKC